jgi:sarcosine oxidase subunit beta
MSVTEPVPYSIKPAVGVFTSIEEESVYFRQVLRGNVIIGGSTRGPAYPDICRAYVVPQNTLSQLKHICRLAPALARLNIIRVWSGVEGYLPDGRPVLGSSERVSGLYYAFGFCGSGFQIGPGVGESMAELIDTGVTSTPMDSYRIGRFAPNDARAASAPRDRSARS